MNLTQAFGLQRGDVLALVGAGGKTSVIQQLSAELTAQGLTTLSTLTGISHPQPHSSSAHQLAMGSAPLPPPTLDEALETHRHVLVYQKLLSDGKLQGLRTGWFDEHIAHAPGVDVALVEADSANGLPFKAPLSSEPSIPASATLVVVVVGMDVLGQPLDNDHVYGADLIAANLEVPYGSEITPRLISKVLSDPQLGLKNVPAGVRVAILLNKVSSQEMAEAADTIAHWVLWESDVWRVAISSLLSDDDPIVTLHRRVEAIVLAAGLSSRMGQSKALLPWGDTTVLRHICDVVTDADMNTTVVLGHKANAIADTLQGLPITTLYNQDYETGEMLSSLKIGIHSLFDQNLDACMIVMGDQPTIQIETIQKLLQVYREGHSNIIRPTFNGAPGHPILIDRRYWQDILDLPPDSIPRDVIHAHNDDLYVLEVDTPSVVQDIDTPEAYQQALDNLQSNTE